MRSVWVPKRVYTCSLNLRCANQVLFRSPSARNADHLFNQVASLNILGGDGQDMSKTIANIAVSANMSVSCPTHPTFGELNQQTCATTASIHGRSVDGALIVDVHKFQNSAPSREFTSCFLRSYATTSSTETAYQEQLSLAKITMSVAEPASTIFKCVPCPRNVNADQCLDWPFQNLGPCSFHLVLKRWIVCVHRTESLAKVTKVMKFD